jgi:hypothetical protein
MLAPLKEWYQAFAFVRPGRVRFDLPPDGLSSLANMSIGERSDVALLDKFLRAIV